MSQNWNSSFPNLRIRLIICRLKNNLMLRKGEGLAPWQIYSTKPSKSIREQSATILTKRKNYGIIFSCHTVQQERERAMVTKCSTEQFFNSPLKTSKHVSAPVTAIICHCNGVKGEEKNLKTSLLNKYVLSCCSEKLTLLT